MSIELDFIFDQAAENLPIRRLEMESAIDTIGEFEKLEEFLFARGYFKTVRGMLEIYIKKGDKK